MLITITIVYHLKIPLAQLIQQIDAGFVCIVVADDLRFLFGGFIYLSILVEATEEANSLSCFVDVRDHGDSIRVDEQR